MNGHSASKSLPLEYTSSVEYPCMCCDQIEPFCQLKYYLSRAGLWNGKATMNDIKTDILAEMLSDL